MSYKKGDKFIIEIEEVYILSRASDGSIDKSSLLYRIKGFKNTFLTEEELAQLPKYEIPLDASYEDGNDLLLTDEELERMADMLIASAGIPDEDSQSESELNVAAELRHNKPRLDNKEKELRLKNLSADIKSSGRLSEYDMDKLKTLELDVDMFTEFYEDLADVGLAGLFETNDISILYDIILPEKGGPYAVTDALRRRARIEELSNEFLEDDVIKSFLNEIQNMPILEAGEEQELISHMLNGDREARRRLNEEYLGDVVLIASVYRDRGLPYLDLVQEGNLGLVNALNKYDGNCFVSFSAFIRKMIREAIKNALSSREGIKLPASLNTTINKMRRFTSDFNEEHGRKPTESEIAENLNMPIDQVYELSKFANDSASFEELHEIDDSSAKRIGEFSSNPDHEESVTLSLLVREQLEEALDILTPRERKVIELRFGILDGKARTLAEIAKELDVTGERIRQIEAKALRKLRHPQKSTGSHWKDIIY